MDNSPNHNAEGKKKKSLTQNIYSPQLHKVQAQAKRISDVQNQDGGYTLGGWRVVSGRKGYFWGC